MTPAPRVAVVILNWNGIHFLEQFLPSVITGSRLEQVELVVADNGSTDHSIEFLRSQYPSIRVIELGENLGFTRGYNRALAQVQADYYVLLNSDVEVTVGWLEPMLALLEGDPSIAACQPKILSFHQKNLFEYAGAAGGWLDRFGYPFSKGRIFEFCEEDMGQYDQQEPIFWASGAALFIRASVFHAMRGFDESFFAHQEEIDLCWRIQLEGYRVYSCPASVVYHVGGGTLPRGNSRKTYLNFRNNLIMLAKNLPLGRACWVIPVRIMLDATSAWKEMLSGDPGYFRAVAHAHGSFLKWLLGNKRRSLFPEKKRARLDGWWRGSVVWQHFVRKRNRFSEIVPKSN